MIIERTASPSFHVVIDSAPVIDTPLVETVQTARIDSDVEEFHRKKQIELGVISLLKNTPEEKYLMEGTGFNVPGNIAQLIEAHQSGNIDGYRAETRDQLEGYIKEFLMRLPVLPYDLTMTNINGTQRLCVFDRMKKDFVPLASVLNTNERNGAVLRRTYLLEKLLAEAKPNSMFVTTSPDGPHGLHENYMSGGEYLESQTGIYMLDENRHLQVLTLRTSMTLRENERLLEQLSGGQYLPSTGSDWNRITDVVDTVVKSTKTTPAEIVADIATIMGNRTAWIDRDKNGKVLQEVSFADIYNQLNNISRLDVAHLLQSVAPEIDSFDAFVKKQAQNLSPADIRHIVVKLGDTLGRISSRLRREVFISENTTKDQPYDFDNERSFQQSLGGCSESVFGELGQRAVGSGEFIAVKYDVCRWLLCDSRVEQDGGHLFLIENPQKRALGPCDVCEKCQEKFDNNMFNESDIERIKSRDSRAKAEKDSSEYQQTSLIGAIVANMFSLN